MYIHTCVPKYLQSNLVAMYQQSLDLAPLEEPDGIGPDARRLWPTPAVPQGVAGTQRPQPAACLQESAELPSEQWPAVGRS